MEANEILLLVFGLFIAYLLYIVYELAKPRLIEATTEPPTDVELLESAVNFSKTTRFELSNSLKSVYAKARGKPHISCNLKTGADDILRITAPYHSIRLVIWSDVKGEPTEKMRQDIGSRSAGDGVRVALTSQELKLVRKIIENAKHFNW